MLTAIALSLALTQATGCVQVEVVATGRSAHGSAIMPQSAPHLLIKALDRLPSWVGGSTPIAAARISSLVAAPAINVIPRRAAATLEIDFDLATLSPDDLVADLARALGTDVEIERLPTACRPRP